MTTYQATRKASPELRECMKRRYFVPFPLTDDEAADFALYLGAQGVQITWSRRHPGAFMTDGVDMCPFAWPWRVGRGELRALAQADAGGEGCKRCDGIGMVSSARDAEGLWIPETCPECRGRGSTRAPAQAAAGGEG